LFDKVRIGIGRLLEEILVVERDISPEVIHPFLISDINDRIRHLIFQFCEVSNTLIIVPGNSLEASVVEYIEFFLHTIIISWLYRAIVEDILEAIVSITKFDNGEEILGKCHFEREKNPFFHIHNQNSLQIGQGTIRVVYSGNFP
jgi:hypothetical protein